MRCPSTSLALLLITSLATAQYPSLPSCAQPCFTRAASNTTCAPTDYYCQCTLPASSIIEALATTCLCHSTCTTVELLQVVQDSNKICSSALAASSSSYKPATVGLGACATATGSSTGSGMTGTGPSATETGTATAMGESTSGSGTGSAVVATQTAISGAGGVGADGFGNAVGALGVVGMAVLAL